MKNNIAICLLSLTFALPVLADDYHYRETLIGERAAGLGGAYIAISDDPSGIWYNPAGIMFSFENYFSLSGNVYSSTKEVAKNAVAGQDYSTTSQGLVPSFFGFTQNYGKSKLGFAIVVPNDDRIDQNDEITNISSTAGRAKTLSRRFYRQNTTTGIGLAYATELRKNMTMGLSLFGMYKSDRQIDNQLILFNADGGGKERYQILNGSITQDIISAYPKLGFQWMPSKDLSLGMTLAKKFGISSKGKLRTYSNKTDATTGTPLDPDPVTLDLTDLKRDLSGKDISPLEFGAGISYFPSPDLLTAFDFTYFSADSSSGTNILATWNIATGIEYYVTEKSAFRAGFYTNNANTAKLKPGVSGQLPNVDMYHLTLGYSVASEGSTFSFGTSLGNGKGETQVVSGSAIQTLERTSMAIYLTGSYQM